MTMPLSFNNFDPDSHFCTDARTYYNDDCEYLNEQNLMFIEKSKVMDIAKNNFTMIHLYIRSTSKHLT